MGWFASNAPFGFEASRLADSPEKRGKKSSQNLLSQLQVHHGHALVPTPIQIKLPPPEPSEACAFLSQTKPIPLNHSQSSDHLNRLFLTHNSLGGKNKKHWEALQHKISRIVDLTLSVKVLR